MHPLASQRCFNHAQREAVARCPQCGHCFCRECITEHDDKVICASCLRTLAQARPLRQRTFAGLTRGVQCLLGLIAAWFFFYLVGEGLLALPTSFHDNTVWKVNWWDQK